MSITMSSGQVESSQSLESSHSCRQFTIAEIQLVTDNFDESLVIGHGGFGKVYRGTITHGVTRLDVAVKRLDTTSNQGALEFWAEVKMLSKLRHCNLVSLIGYCNDIQEMILVYEFMSRGTLEDYLHKLRAPLTWVRRLKICIGAGRGLDYLHTGTGINHGVIHRDVKSSNILLDDTWGAKISDFGLSKIGPINQADSGVNTLVKGTFGYLDPDYYQTGRLTRKSDVYAFGVVLFEVLCEKRAVDTSLDEDQWGLARWVQDSIKEGRLKQIVDHNISDKISARCLKDFAKLAVECLHSHPKQRPTMAQVVAALECILALQEKEDNKLREKEGDNLQEKEDDKLQARGMTIFGKKNPTFVSNWENSVGVRSLKSLELYIGTIRGENQLLRRFLFDTLKVATGNFSEANKIFEHRYGSLYKGRLQNGQVITIFGPYSNLDFQLINDLSNKKILNRVSDKQFKKRVSYKQLMNEVSILVKLQHKNLIEFVGYCIEGPILLLVYNFAPRKTLHSMLYDPECTILDWNKRYQILLEIARVLVYLHNQAPGPIIHGDLNSRNVVLDENFYPKLLDFGFASQIEETDYAELDRICATQAYIAPEYFRGLSLSTKVDVYSFGLLVLETITGRYVSEFYQSVQCHNYQARRLLPQGPIAYLTDPSNVDLSTAEIFISIGLSCIVSDPMLRPTMEEVVDMFLNESSIFLFLQKQEEGLADNDYDTVAVDDFRQELCPR